MTSAPIPLSYRERIARHEAAHVAAAFALGRSVEFVEVTYSAPLPDGSRRLHGRTRYVEADRPSTIVHPITDALREWFELDVQATLAGALAVWNGPAPTTPEAFGQAFAGEDADLARIGFALNVLAEFDPDAVEAIVPGLVQRTAGLLALPDVTADIEAIAAELLEPRRLTGTELRRIVAALPAPSVGAVA
jgi:hypothetical protein